MPAERSNHTLRRTTVVVGMIAGLGLAFGSPATATEIHPDASRIVREMTEYLSKLPAFSVRGDVDDELIDLDGQKLQISSSASLVVERPAHFYAHRQGPVADLEAFFDGSTLTLHGKRIEAYMQLDISGTIDTAITGLRSELGLGVPAGDLFYADAYEGLMTDVTSGTYMGTAYVGGTEVHHLAFRAKKVDWQLWVKTGAQPLPMKYVITSKWLTGAPAYSVRFQDWNTTPKISASQFKFAPPKGATKVDAISVNELGTLSIEEAR